MLEMAWQRDLALGRESNPAFGKSRIEAEERCGKHPPQGQFVSLIPKQVLLSSF